MTERELLMPFVTVASTGGPHDDESYQCGWEMGALDAELRTVTPGTTTIRRIIKATNRPQADLIAMKHGFVLTVIDSPYEWLDIELRAMTDDPTEHEPPLGEPDFDPERDEE